MTGLDPVIHVFTGCVFTCRVKDVDGRREGGHDEVAGGHDGVEGGLDEVGPVGQNVTESERQLHAGRQLQPARDLLHFGL
jgi:hypothetical protein